MKKQHLGPLPGTAKKYLDTITKCLAFVKETNPSPTSFISWFQREFPSFKSEQLVEDCIRTIQNLGLITATGSTFTLSQAAREFLITHNKRVLNERLDTIYVGVHDILEILREKPSTLEEIITSLENKASIKWKTATQYLLRLNWLLGLGSITKTGRHYSLTEEGRNIVEREKEVVEEHPTHNEIRDRIVETGKLLEYISESEYKTDGYVLDAVWKIIEEGHPAFVFEVLLEGDLSQALVRLKYASRKFGGPELFLVTDQKYMTQASNVIRTTFREMVDVIRVIHWKDINELKETIIRLRETTGKMRYSPTVVLRRRMHKKRLLKPSPPPRKKRIKGTKIRMRGL